MTIKARLIILALVVVSGLTGQAVLSRYSLHSLAELEENRVLAERLASDVLMLRRHEKDFLARFDTKYHENFSTTFGEMSTRIERLTASLQSAGISRGDLEKFGSIAADYRQAFDQLVAIQKRIGLNPKDGLYGTLREAVHGVEELLKEHDDDRLMRHMLMLRRNEKDFMLRRDIKYIKSFDNNLAVFREAVGLSDHDPAVRELLLSRLDSYDTDFHALVKAEQEKGLTSSQGVLGQMRDTVHETESALSTLNSSLEAAVSEADERTGWMTAIISFIIIGVVIVLVGVVANAVLAPVLRLQRVMEQVRREENLTLRAEVKGRDEVASMAENFNRLLADFQGIIREVFNSTDRLSTASEELSSITEETSAAMREQLNETDQVATAVEQMSATVQDVARNTTATAQATEEAEQSAGRGKQVVGSTSDSINALAGEVRRAAEVIGRLDQESAEVGKVLDVINAIAEQTNLLALNAAIEAARAGEQGRGFAVVADEVRTLAQRTQQAIGEIEGIIGRLQTGAREAVAVMESGNTRSEAAVSSAEEAGAAIGVIDGVVRNIHRMTQEIAAAAEEQGTVAANVARNVSAIKQNADTTGDSVHHIAAASDELSQLANSLHQHVMRFKV